MGRSLMQEIVNWYLLIGMGVLALLLASARRATMDKYSWQTVWVIVVVTIMFWPRVLRMFLSEAAKEFRRLPRKKQ